MFQELQNDANIIKIDSYLTELLMFKLFWKFFLFTRYLNGKYNMKIY